jgi:hypothetical protein
LVRKNGSEMDVELLNPGCVTFIKNNGALDNLVVSAPLFSVCRVTRRRIDQKNFFVDNEFENRATVFNSKSLGARNYQVWHRDFSLFKETFITRT